MSSLKLQGMQPLFYSPLSVFELESAAALNAELLAEANAIRAQSPGLDRSNWHGWHSNDDFFERSEPGCQALRQHIVEAIQLCTRNVSPSFDFSLYDIQAEDTVSQVNVKLHNLVGKAGGFSIHRSTNGRVYALRRRERTFWTYLWLASADRAP